MNMLRRKPQRPSPPEDNQTRKALILRDSLAIDRTKLANQRTVLSFFRTGLSLIVTSLAIFQFSKSEAAFLAARGMIVMGSIIIIVGFFNYVKVNRNINRSYFEDFPGGEGG